MTSAWLAHGVAAAAAAVVARAELVGGREASGDDSVWGLIGNR